MLIEKYNGKTCTNILCRRIFCTKIRSTNFKHKHIYVSVCKWVFDAYHRFSIGENWILFVTQPDFRMFIGLCYIFVFNKHFRNRWTMRTERFCTQTHMNAFHLKEKETEREWEKKRFLSQVSVKSEIKYLNFNYISRPAEWA